MAATVIFAEAAPSSLNANPALKQAAAQTSQ